MTAPTGTTYAAVTGQTPEEHRSDSQADMTSDRLASHTAVDRTNIDQLTDQPNDQQIDKSIN